MRRYFVKLRIDKYEEVYENLTKAEAKEKYSELSNWLNFQEYETTKSVSFGYDGMIEYLKKLIKGVDR